MTDIEKLRGENAMLLAAADANALLLSQAAADQRNMVAALSEALPWLILLGDFIGNGTEVNPEGRCNAVLAVRNALRR